MIEKTASATAVDRQSESDDVVLRVDGVRKAFGSRTLFEDLRLDVMRREFLTLLGPSGCGKSTLLRIIAGLDFPDGGAVVLDGVDVTKRPANRRPLNLVFQRATLFPYLSVAENVAFGLRLKRVARHEREERVAEVLRLVRLAGFGGRNVSTLSGGEAQRVALARALVNRPRILLLDEPLSALDLQIRRELQAELKDLHRRLESTFIYVTHDQEEAMSMADRIVLMNGGKIVQVGSPVDSYRRPGSVFAAGFIGQANLFAGDVVGREGELAVVQCGELRVRCVQEGSSTVGQHVHVVIRPEAISVDVGSGEVGTLELGREFDGVTGRIEDVTFLGPAVAYRIRCGDLLLAATASMTGHDLLVEGASVRAVWRTADAVVLTG